MILGREPDELMDFSDYPPDFRMEVQASGPGMHTRTGYAVSRSTGKMFSLPGEVAIGARASLVRHGNCGACGNRGLRQRFAFPEQLAALLEHQPAAMDNAVVRVEGPHGASQHARSERDSPRVRHNLQVYASPGPQRAGRFDEGAAGAEVTSNALDVHQLLELIFGDSQLNVYAGKLDVRPPGAPITDLD
jgi:hypothetical protein